MIKFDGEELASEFHEVLGKPITSVDKLQAWWLVKFAKHVRGRCRNNAAFNNFMNRNFKHLKFSEIDKVGERGPYKGLVITED